MLLEASHSLELITRATLEVPELKQEGTAEVMAWVALC